MINLNLYTELSELGIGLTCTNENVSFKWYLMLTLSGYCLLRLIVIKNNRRAL